MRVERSPALDRQGIGAAAAEIEPGEMQLRQCRADRRAVARTGTADPHAIEEGDHRRRPAGDLAQHLALAVLDRLRAGDAARVQVLHQAEKERQVLGGHPLLVEREDEVAAAGVDEKVRVLDPFRDALVGEQLADIVAGEKGSKILRRYVRVDGHCEPPRWRMTNGEDGE